MLLNILLNALKFKRIKRIEVIEVNFNQSEAELHMTSLWKSAGKIRKPGTFIASVSGFFSFQI